MHSTNGNSTTNGHSTLNGDRPVGATVANKETLCKGLSFTPEERINKNLTGLIPHTMESLQAQCARAMMMINTRQTNIDKYLYLSGLKDQNVDLFYRLLIDNVRELMPLVYTPTIGDVCLQYSTLYTRPEALYISIKQRKSIRTMLRNWPYPNPEICVVTDGSRILGLGDLGINGVGISVSISPVLVLVLRVACCTPTRSSVSVLHAVPIFSHHVALRRATACRPGVLPRGRSAFAQTSFASLQCTYVRAACGFLCACC